MLPHVQPYTFATGGATTSGHFEDISTRALQTVTVGQGSGKISSGTGNAFVGYESGHMNTNGSYNTFSGYQAGYQNANASYCTMIGAFAGRNNNGAEVVFAGYRAGEINRDGRQLVAIGPYAMRENVSGTGSVAIGYRSAERNQDGDFNTFVGAECGQNNRSGNMNTMCGFRAGRANFMGNENTYFGAFAGYSNTQGSGNCLIGYKCGEVLANGDLNVAIGAYALQYAKSGNRNIAIGPYAGQSMVTGSDCVIIGTGAGTVGQGNENVILGTYAGKSAADDRNVIIGYAAGVAADIRESVIIGANSASQVRANNSVIIGYNTAHSAHIGSSNIIIGSGADIYSSTVDNSICFGTKDTYVSTYGVSIGQIIFNRRPYSTLIGYQLECDATNSIVIGHDINVQSIIYFKDPLSMTTLDTVLDDGDNKLGIRYIQYGLGNEMLRDVDNPTDIYPNAIAGPITSNTYSSATNPPKGFVHPLAYRKTIETNSCNIPTVFVQGTFLGLSNSDQLYSLWSISKEALNYKGSLDYLYDPDFVFTLNVHDYLLTHTYNATVEFAGPYTGNVIVNGFTFGNSNFTVPVTVTKSTQHPQFPMSEYAVTHNYSWYNKVPLATPIIHWSSNGINLYDNNVGELVYVVTKPPSYGTLYKSFFSCNETIEYMPFQEYAYMYEQDEVRVLPSLQFTDKHGSNYSRSGDEVVIHIPRSNTSPHYMYKKALFITGTQPVYTLSIADILAIPHISISDTYVIDVLQPDVSIVFQDMLFSILTNSRLVVTYQDIIGNGIHVSCMTESTYIENAYMIANNDSTQMTNVSIHNLKQQLVPPLYTIPRSIQLFNDPFVNFSVQHVLHNGVECDMRFLSYPSYGIFVANNSSTFTYTVIDPFKPLDAFDVLLTSNQYNDVCTVNITQSNQAVHYQSHILGYNSLFGNTNFSNYEESYTSSVSAVQLSNVHSYRVSNIDANSVSEYELYQPIEYSPVVGYSAITSNVYISSYVGEFAIDVEYGMGCNLLYHSMHIVQHDIIRIDGTPESYPAYDVYNNTYVGFVSNMSGYNCNVYITSNIYIQEIRNVAYDMTSNIHNTSNVQFLYYDAYNPHDMLYMSNVQITNMNAPEVIQTPTLSHVSLNTANEFTTTVVHVVYVPVIQLNSNILYSTSDVFTIVQEPNYIIQSNIGMVREFSQAQVNNRDIYVVNGGQLDTIIIGLNSAKHSSYFSITCSFVNGRNITNVSPQYTINNLQLSVPFVQVAALLDPSDKNVQFTPDKVHIMDAHGMFVWGDLNINIDDIGSTRSSLTTPSFEATLMFMYSSNQMSHVTTPITCSFSVDMKPHTVVQHFNKGVSIYKSNTLSPYVFNWSPSTVLTVAETSTNVTVSADSFTLEDIVNNNVYIDFTTDDPGFITFTEGTTIHTIPYTYDIYPIATAKNYIYLQDIGSHNHSCRLQGAIWDYVDALWQYSSQDIDVIVATSIYNGILWNRTKPFESVQSFTVEDLTYGNIYYIPFDHNDVDNIPTKSYLKYKTSEFTSPSYDIDIKNYISRFPNITYCCTYNVLTPLHVNNIVSRSKGIVRDDLSWSPPTLSIARQLSNIGTYELDMQLGGSNNTYSWLIPLYADSKSLTTLSNALYFTYDIGRTECVSVRVLLQNLMSHITYDPYTMQDCIFYVSNKIGSGFLRNVRTHNNAVTSFTLHDMLDDKILYQQYGTSDVNDTLTIRVSTTPYDMIETRINVHLNIYDAASIVKNDYIFVYASDAKNATSTIYNIHPSTMLSIEMGYIHMMNDTSFLSLVDKYSMDTVQQLTTSIQSYNYNMTGFKISSNVFNNIDLYDALYIDVATTVTNTSENFLLLDHPFYSKEFKHPIQVKFNTFLTSNAIVQHKQAQQSISYDFSSNTTGYANLNNNSFTFFLQFKPYQNLLDISSQNGTVTELSELLSYEFSVHMHADDNSELISFTLNNDVLTVDYNGSSITISSSVYADFIAYNSWNNILFVNKDIDYPVYEGGNITDFKSSLYIGYDTNQSKLQNKSKNALNGFNVIVPYFTALSNINIFVDNQSPYNVLSSYQYVQRANDLYVVYDVFNNGTQLQFRNVEMYVSTYSPIQEDTVTSYNNHNVVLGRNLTVRGLNNICVGNEFNTSGQNSIILGNNIGKGTSSDGVINEIYESIVIGNNSFQNSLVNNVIAIGNNNLNLLNTLERSKVTEFLASKPVILGNDIEFTDFNINIGNVFLKSSSLGNKVYLGVHSEKVYIGYSNVATITDNYTVNVNGTLHSSSIMSKSVNTRTFVTPYTLAEGFQDDDVLHKVVSIDTHKSDCIMVYEGLHSSNVMGVYVGRNLVQYHGIVDVLCDTDVRVGALLSTSNGYAIQQDDAIYYNFTIGKALSSCTNGMVKCKLV